MPESLYIIDVFSLVFQVFHAIPEMTSPAGQPTNAAFGFTRDLLNLLKQQQPTHWICALDSSGPGEREAMYPLYKANRSEMPEALRPQIPMVGELIDAFGIPRLQLAGWEADDLIATAVTQAEKRGMNVFIVSNDKDARQLLSPLVKVFSVRKNQILDEAGLLLDWGIKPEQVVDYQALVGDSVDNIPGVPLIGPKKASALLQQFGTLDEVLAHSDQAPGAKLRENLKTFAEQARLSRRLATLNRELPVTVDWDAARSGQLNRDRLLELFTNFGFRRFGDEIRELQPGDQPAGRPPLKHTVVDTPAKFAEFLAKLQRQKEFCLDLETTALDAVRADIVGWAVSWEPFHGYYLPVQGPPGSTLLEPAAVVAALKPILESPEIAVTNQNIKYDMLVLRRAGISLRHIGMDPMVGSYLLDAGARTHSQDELSRRYLQHEMIPLSDLIGKGLFQQGMQEVEIPKIAEYAAEDATIAWELAGLIRRDLEQEKLWELYWDLERPLIEVLVEMQHNGIRVAVDELRDQSRNAAERLIKIRDEIFSIAGHEFNIDSPIQLRNVLFTELKLPVISRTKTGPSTDQDVLEQLAFQHPLPQKILEHRRLSKLKSTYLEALPEAVNPATGKIHCSFNQVVAATGRLSASEPNLQNIPVRTEEGRKVREAFLPSQPDWRLLCADYSQIELRMLAHFSGDEAMIAAFAEDRDIHTAVAAQVHCVSLDSVDSEMRRVAKAVNFGVIYGQSPFGLAAALGISQEAAGKFIDDYFAKYAGVDRFLTQILEESARTGYATTILGRRRAITGIRLPVGKQRNLPERTAINTVIQGSAADLIKRAMINVFQKLREANHPGRMLLQIHDELVLEAPVDRIPELGRLVKREMEAALPLSVPLKVDLSVGEDWLNVRPWDTITS